MNVLNTQTQAQLVSDIRDLRCDENSMVCFRFHGLDGFDAWVDAKVIVETYDNSLRDYLAEETETDVEVIDEVLNRDYELVDTNHTLTSHCGGSFSFDFEKYAEILEVLEDVDTEVLSAGLALGLEIESIRDNYFGYFGSERELAEYHVDEGLMGEVPENLKNYLDYDHMGRELSWDYSEHEGHYFHN